jgi:hypothetical protein
MKWLLMFLAMTHLIARAKKSSTIIVFAHFMQTPMEQSSHCVIFMLIQYN